MSDLILRKLESIEARQIKQGETLVEVRTKLETLAVSHDETRRDVAALDERVDSHDRHEARREGEASTWARWRDRLVPVGAAGGGVGAVWAAVERWLS